MPSLRELDVHGVRDDARLDAALEEELHRLAPARAVVERPVVHVHADEAVGEVQVEPAPELKRVCHGLIAMLQAQVDRLPQQLAQPLRDALAEHTGLPVVVDKDTNAAALGLALRERTEADFAYLHLGTGLGAGLVLGGALHRGARTGAGEFVGIDARRGPAAIVAMIGSFKAGRPFIFIDERDSDASNSDKVRLLGIRAFARAGAGGGAELTEVPERWRHRPVVAPPARSVRDGIRAAREARPTGLG